MFGDPGRWEVLPRPQNPVRKCSFGNLLFVSIEEPLLLKILFIVRHAHRDTDAGRERDNGLDKKGRIQAVELVRFFEKLSMPTRPVLASSRLKRCVETLEPLQKYFKTE